MLSFVQEQNDCSATGGNQSTANDELIGSVLFQAKPTQNLLKNSQLNDFDGEFSQVKPVEFKTD